MMSAHHHSPDIHLGHDLDWEALAADLERGAEVQLQALEQAAAWLGGLLAGRGRDGAAATPVTRIMDVGSGPGVATCLLARSFPQAEVVAVDGAEAMLQRTMARAAEHGVADRVRIRRADLPDGLDEAGDADLIWASKSIHHLPDQQATLNRLAAAVRPGGLLAVAEGGLSARFLPRDIGLGRPGLQARLEAANEDWFIDMRATLPGAVATIEDWPAMLARAGLIPAGTRSFLVDLPAPLDARTRAHIHAHLTRIREVAGAYLTADDLQVLDALLDQDAPTGIHARPDAFYLAVSTVHAAWAM